MLSDVKHIGLYFGQSEIDKAQAKENDDLQSAWQWLLAQSGDLIKERKPKDRKSDPEQVIKADLPTGGKLIEAAFRYRFADNADAANQASEILATGYGLTEQASLFESISQTLTAAHAFEMIRDTIPDSKNWLKEFAGFSDKLQVTVEDANFLEQLWLTTLLVVSGVVLEDDSRFETGISRVKEIVDTKIHPEGYFKPLSEIASDKESAFNEMVSACAALSLACEAATQAGENLWQYENRDVSLNTSVTYLVYYYFYPDKWRWGEGDLTEEQTRAIFSQSGAWIEISTLRVNPRGVELLLDEQRPFFNAYMGGLTTLSHIKTERAWRIGLFG